MSDFTELQQQATDIRRRYNELNKAKGREAWDARAYAMGLAGDLGDLMKHIMAAENFRDVKGGGEALDRLRHELGDCLWSLLVIAEHYHIDLKTAFDGTMAELRERIAGGTA